MAVLGMPSSWLSKRIFFSAYIFAVVVSDCEQSLTLGFVNNPVSALSDFLNFLVFFDSRFHYL